MKKITTVFIIGMFMVLGFISPASAAVTVTQTTINSYNDTTPRINNNGDAVWAEKGPDDLYTNIFVFDAATRLITQLTKSTNGDHEPQINDRGDIVWTTYNPNESYDSNIMLYIKSTNTITRISLPHDPLYQHYDNHPQINNVGQVVWSGAVDGPLAEILFYNGTTVERVTTTSTVYDDWPMLNDSGDIVWEASVNYIADIKRRDGVTKVITPLTSTPVVEMMPRINNTGDIVWAGWDGATMSSGVFQIYYWKKSSGEITPITTTAIDNISPQINATGQIAWGTTSDTADYEIYFRTSVTGTNINISNSASHDDFSPSLNDNGWIAWNQDQGTTSENNQIFVWDGLLPATSHVTRYNIPDAYDHINPDINNSNAVIWQGTGGTGTPTTDYEIYIARQGPGPCDDAATRCDDGNVCTTDSCDPASGACIHTNNTLSCNDNDICTTNDKCSAGVCTGTHNYCTDTNPCTTDYCVAGICFYDSNTVACNDNNRCTVNDVCSNRACKGTPKACADSNPCTTDYCNPQTGLCRYDYNTLPCNDNNACTTGDACSSGVCMGIPMDCDDNNPCTIDTCDPAQGACSHAETSCPDCPVVDGVWLSRPFLFIFGSNLIHMTELVINGVTITAYQEGDGGILLASVPPDQTPPWTVKVTTSAGCSALYPKPCVQ